MGGCEHCCTGEIHFILHLKQHLLFSKYPCCSIVKVWRSLVIFAKALYTDFFWERQALCDPHVNVWDGGFGHGSWGDFLRGFLKSLWYTHNICWTFEYWCICEQNISHVWWGASVTCLSWAGSRLCSWSREELCSLQIHLGSVSVCLQSRIALVQGSSGFGHSPLAAFIYEPTHE